MDDKKYLTVPANVTAETLKRRLSECQKTFFMRFGDSELNMLENIGHTSKTQKNNLVLQEVLREAVKVDHEDYLIAPGIGLDNREYSEISKTGLENPLRHNPQLDAMGRRNIVRHRPLKIFENCHALTLKFMYDIPWFLNYCDILRKKDPLFIGGESLCCHKNVKKIFGFKDYLSMPDKQSFCSVQQNMDTIWKYVKDRDVVVCVLGASTKVLGYNLWRMGWDGYFLDPGSIVNALADQMVRGWMITGDFLTPEMMRIYEEHEFS